MRCLNIFRPNFSSAGEPDGDRCVFMGSDSNDKDPEKWSDGFCSSSAIFDCLCKTSGDRMVKWLSLIWRNSYVHVYIQLLKILYARSGSLPLTSKRKSLRFVVFLVCIFLTVITSAPAVNASRQSSFRRFALDSKKNLCVPQTETVVEHITEILSSIGQIGLTMLLFLVILGFAPSKVQGLIQRCCCCCCCCCCCLWALERGVVGARWRWRRPWRCWSCSALAPICPSRCRSGPARRRAA